MALGVDPNSGNKNFWQLYARDPKVRQGAQQKYEIGGQSFGGQGTTGPAGFQALYEQFNQMDARALTGSNGAAKGTSEIAATPATGAVKETSEIPATSAAGAKEVTNPFEVTQTASSGKIERPGDNDGSNYKNLELNPVVASAELTNKLQYFA